MRLSRPAQGSLAFRPAHLHLGCAKDFPGGSSRAISHLACSSGYRGVPTIPRTGLSPAGLRDPGGLSLNFSAQRQTSFRAALPPKGTKPARLSLRFHGLRTAYLRQIEGAGTLERPKHGANPPERRYSLPEISGKNTRRAHLRPPLHRETLRGGRLWGRTARPALSTHKGQSGREAPDREESGTVSLPELPVEKPIPLGPIPIPPVESSPSPRQCPNIPRQRFASCGNDLPPLTTEHHRCTAAWLLRRRIIVSLRRSVSPGDDLPPEMLARRRSTAACLSRRRLVLDLRRFAATDAGLSSLYGGLAPAAADRRLSSPLCLPSATICLPRCRLVAALRQSAGLDAGSSSFYDGLPPSATTRRTRRQDRRRRR